MRNWLYNQYVVLSGASGGIGRALAKILIQKYGARVIGIGRSEEKMQSLQAELGELAPAFTYYLFDVSIKENWLSFREKLDADGVRPTLLINNAGIFPPLKKGLDTPTETVEKVLQNNFLSSVYAIEALSSYLVPSGKQLPAIVNISSSAALCPVVGSSAYSASKSALKGYTECLQLEEKGRKYVGIVYPGTTATDLFRDDTNVQGSAMEKIAMSPEKMAKKIARRIYKRKKRSVVGFDAKMMSFLVWLMPSGGPALIRWVMKISKSKAFNDVFDENNKENQV